MSFSRYFLGLNHYDCNELDEAAAQFEIIVDDPYRYPMQNVTHCSFLLSLTYQAQGLQDRALEVAENIMNFVFEHENRMFIDLAGAFKAELDLRQGRTVQANRWAKDFTSPPPHVMHRYFNTELTAFRILMAQDTSESRRAAAEGLESIHQILSRSHHKRLMMDVLGLKALLADAGGDSDTAVALLEEAVYLGQPGQLIRPLADLGPGIFSLLNRLNLDQEGLQYLGMIVSALRSSSGESIDSSRCPPLPETLSQRELEILGLFARELSNKEIAGRLFISTGTVKRHAHNIYSKLSVTTRRDAVSKAMRLGILVID
jgi:LuxR family maltose regulon positive regulatory protein